MLVILFIVGHRHDGTFLSRFGVPVHAQSAVMPFLPAGRTGRAAPRGEKAALPFKFCAPLVGDSVRYFFPAGLPETVKFHGYPGCSSAVAGAQPRYHLLMAGCGRPWKRATFQILAYMRNAICISLQFFQIPFILNSTTLHLTLIYCYD